MAENTNSWKLLFKNWIPAEEPLREALCTLGNGYFATRGAAEEASAGGIHRPGTYLAGKYNRLETTINTLTFEYEKLVNWPNWLPLTFRLADGEWLNPDAMTVTDYQQALDLRHGLLERKFIVTDRFGNQTSLISRRFVHMDNPHLGCLQWELKALNWSGPIHIRSALDGAGINQGTSRYPELDGNHFRTFELSAPAENIVVLSTETTRSRIRMTQAARTRLLIAGESQNPAGHIIKQEKAIVAEFTYHCFAEKPVLIEKIVALYTSRDPAIRDEFYQAQATVKAAPDFTELFVSHRQAWDRLWQRCDIRLSLPEENLALRLYIFHIVQAVSPNSLLADTGVPARGLHGEAYLGHIFWDELFAFPFFNFHFPEVARHLLLYRYERLPAARSLAERRGFNGALYPWRSASDGQEATPPLYYNPRSGHWLPDYTYLQYHLSSAVAYNFWHYFLATDDKNFLILFGAEVILSIARFWSSAARWDSRKQRYCICGVVGPDEFHTHYPDAQEPGVDNNTYTNVLAVWVLRCASRLLTLLPEQHARELTEKTGITRQEQQHWEDIIHKMYLPLQGQGIFSQFEGYEGLLELDWAGYRRRYGNIRRMDDILEAEGDSVNRYKVSKQADVLTLFYLFSREELTELCQDLDYPLNADIIRRNVDYYRQRTSNGSTLSYVIHSWVFARENRKSSWNFFRKLLQIDMNEDLSGTTHEGVHLGAMAGTVNLIERCYAGLSLRHEKLWLDPKLPESLAGVRLPIIYRGRLINIEVAQGEISLYTEKTDNAEHIQLELREEDVELLQGEHKKFRE